MYPKHTTQGNFKDCVAGTQIKEQHLISPPQAPSRHYQP